MQTIEPLSSNRLVAESQLVGLVTKRWEKGRTDYQSVYGKLPSYYNTYRGIYAGEFHPFRNNIAVPLTYATAWSDTAVKATMCFDRYPICQMVGYGPEDAAVARKNEILLTAQAKDCNTYAKAIDFFLSSKLYGTSVLQYGWKKMVKKMKRRIPIVNPLAMVPGQEFQQMTGEQIVEENAVTFDGPDWNVLDLLDCVPSSTSKTISDQDYFIVRYWLDLDQIEALAEIGFFDKRAVKELRDRGPSHSTFDEYKDRRNNSRSPQSEDTLRVMDKFSKPVRIVEHWGLVPSEFAPDGVTGRVISVAEDKVLLRNEPIPFWDGEKPFLSYSPTRDPHYFFAPGMVEMTQKMQFTANRLANQKLDALDLLIDPVMMYDKNRFPNKQELYVRSGKTIGTDGPPGEVVTPWAPDMRGVQLAYEEIDQLWQWVETGTGVIRDTIAGGAVTKRQTAREWQGRSERAMSRLALEARCAEEVWIEPLFNAFRRMNRQFLPLPKVVRILGQGALVNPITGLPMPPEPPVVSLSDINQDYDVRAVGASQALGQQQQAQNLILAIQALGATPAAMTLNWPAISRQVFTALELKNVDELTFSLAQMMGMQPPGQPGGQPGSPVPGTPGVGADTSGQPGFVNPEGANR